MNIDEAIKNAIEIAEIRYIHSVFQKERERITDTIEALTTLREKRKKYKWHDLRKNPNDLPHIEHEVDVVCERRYTNGKCTQIRTHAFYEDGIVLENDSIWSWVNLEGEYNEEEDCHVIPEGWWEYRHYNPNDCYNGVIDDCVIAWREIEPFKEK